MAKPTVIPEFAKNDLADPTSGQNNVVEPTTNAKNYGWVPYLTKPFRQWMNWLHRYYYLWIKYINDELEPQVTQNVSDIADNVSDIAVNTANVSANASNIATNVTDIFTNTGNIATNTTNISTNAGNITTNTSAIATKATASNGTIGAKITTSYITVEQTFNVEYYKNARSVMLKLPSVTGISNSNDLRILPQTTWPSDMIVDETDHTIPCIVHDNGNDVMGAVKLPNTTSDYFEFYRIDQSDNNRLKTNIFTSSGDKGIRAQTLSYVAAL